MKKVLICIVLTISFLAISLLFNKEPLEKKEVIQIISNEIMSKNEKIDEKIFQKNQYSLAVDVSQFNIIDNEFKGEIDFSEFIKNNNISYVYIRLGGRGWGTSGNMYYDDNAMHFVDICENMQIPYGFYFLDEALNENEIIEEVNFVNSFFIDKNLNMNLLPLALDMEYQYGKGRADNIWNERVSLINRLVEEFYKIGINTIIYANGARIETYLKNANCKFWVAMYPEDNKIPTNNYKKYIIEEQNKIRNNPELLDSSTLNTELNKCGTETTSYSNEFLDKVVGWQFTESGATGNGINTYIDLSILDNEYFKNFAP